MSGSFEGDLATARAARVCTSTSGTIQFRFAANEVPRPLRLRRILDVGDGLPGVSAGSAGAAIYVNGVLAGSFAPLAANVPRRWQQQEALLDVPVAAQTLDIDVVPAYSAHAPVFSESRWELRGGWRDLVFRDGFEP